MLNFIDAKLEDFDYILNQKLTTNDNRKELETLIGNYLDKYKIVMLDNKRIGYYLVHGFEDGTLIDSIFIEEDYKDEEYERIIIEQIVCNNDKIMAYVDNDNERLISLYKKANFTEEKDDNDRIHLVYKAKNRPKQIMSMLKKISYGFIDHDNGIHRTLKDDIENLYKLQSPDELMESKVGLCWDQVELERDLFSSSGYSCNSFVIVYMDEKRFKNHTFLIYQDRGLYYWFEHAWEKMKGIYVFKTPEEALEKVKEEFIKEELHNDCEEEVLHFFTYQKPKFGIGCNEFIQHMLSSEEIK